jgi:hypothetical protein
MTELLKLAYAAVLSEPIPQEWLDLLARLK